MFALFLLIIFVLDLYRYSFEKFFVLIIVVVAFHLFVEFQNVHFFEQILIRYDVTCEVSWLIYTLYCFCHHLLRCFWQTTIIQHIVCLFALISFAFTISPNLNEFTHTHMYKEKS